MASKIVLLLAVISGEGVKNMGGKRGVKKAHCKK